jgi:hypothetical protein
MKTSTRFAPLALSVMLALGLAACGKSEQAAAPVEAPKVELVVPANPTDERAWKLYLTEVVKANLPEKLNSQPLMYYVPSATVEDFQTKFDSQLDNVASVVSRGVLPGNLVAFGSPESAKMADLIIEAFKDASPGSFNQVRVLFVGKVEDQERVAAALQPSGAEFVFFEMK